MEAEMEAEQIESEEMSAETEQNLEGNEAGRVFAQRHILDKVTLFVDEYRRQGYTEDFISGFLDGINDTTGAWIHLEDNDEESDGEELTTVE
jgi:hypothetical protein